MLHLRVSDSKGNLAKLQSQHNDDVPVNITALEEAKQEAETNKASILNQYRTLQERKAQIDREQHPYIQKIADLKRRIREHEERVEVLKVSLKYLFKR